MILIVMLFVLGLLVYFAKRGHMGLAVTCAIINTFLALIADSGMGS